MPQQDHVGTVLTEELIAVIRDRKQGLFRRWRFCGPSHRSSAIREGRCRTRRLLRNAMLFQNSATMQLNMFVRGKEQPT